MKTEGESCTVDQAYLDDKRGALARARVVLQNLEGLEIIPERALEEIRASVKVLSLDVMMGEALIHPELSRAC